MEPPEEQLLKQILQHYSVGELTHYEVLPLGYVNTSYAVTTSAGSDTHKYLLRRYRAGSKEDGLIFEHSIIRHLEKKGFPLTARVLPTTGGTTYIRHLAVGNGQHSDGELFYALFDFLSGEDRFTWIKPECGPTELAEAGAALARFHDAVSDLTPVGQRSEPPIRDLLPLIADAIKRRLMRRSSSDFESELFRHRELILCATQRAHRAIDVPEYRTTQRLVNHGDYHPGNLKFEGSRVVGLFDLDWSKIDARTFDVGVALTYFCASWDASHPDTYFELDKAAKFLKAYQSTLFELGLLAPLDTFELKLLAEMVAAGNIYVMEWALRDYYGRTDHPPEFVHYLEHHLCLMRWFEDEMNRRKWDQMIAETLLPLGFNHLGRKRASS
jgi:homoserine kinase type II